MDDSNRLRCLSPEEAVAVIDKAQSIAIAGHINPDGDSLGSSLALLELLKAMGKDAVVLLGQDTPAPELYQFLPNYEFIFAGEYKETPDLFIAVDSSTATRLGASERLLTVARDTLVVDHHANYEGYAQHYIGDEHAPATASVIWKIIKASGVAPTLNMASCCYVALMTDTGRFAFRNTNHSAFADAAEMVNLGVDPAAINEMVYANKSFEVMRLEALLVDRMQVVGTGNIAYSFLSKNDLDERGIKRDQTEELPAIIRSLKGVEVSALFRDEGDGDIRVSLRARDNYNVGEFAREFGGGGHAGAAGLTLKMPLEEAIGRVVNKLTADLLA